MHRFRPALLAALAIGAGIPALASAQREGQRPDGEQRGDRPDRGQGGQRPDQGQQRGPDGRGDRPQAQPPQQQMQAPPPQQQQQQAQQVQAQQAQQARTDGRGFDRGNRQPGFDQQGRRPDQGQPGFAGGRDDRRPGADPRPGYDPRRNDGQRPDFDQRQGDQRQGYAGNGHRGGDQRFADGRGRDERGQGYRGASGPQGRFGPEWRSDRRYDWQGYRNQHRDIFRIGRYQPPRGYYNYGYRPFQIGVRLDPYFYASNYWIDDPYDYRLPPVWGSYRWIRYYDDVLLVDLSSGQVVDVIRQFFW